VAAGVQRLTDPLEPVGLRFHGDGIGTTDDLGRALRLGGWCKGTLLMSPAWRSQAQASPAAGGVREATAKSV